MQVSIKQFCEYYKFHNYIPPPYYADVSAIGLSLLLKIKSTPKGTGFEDTENTEVM
jgi:hypothetical protein